MKKEEQQIINALTDKIKKQAERCFTMDGKTKKEWEAVKLRDGILQ